ncbi:MAG: FtsX-like permease family protein [Deltaproteobacteria bacterium]
MQALRVAIFLAYKSIIKGNKSTVFLIIFILSLSFINLIFISSILKGIVEAVDRQVINNLTSNIVIDPQEEPAIKDFILHAAETRREIENIPGVISTASHYKLSATLEYDKDKNNKFKVVSGEIVGINPEEEKLVTGVHKSMVAGRYLEGLGVEEIILGGDLAGGYGGEDLISLGGVKVGDKVLLTFSNGVVRNYKVKGVFLARLGFVDRLAFITRQEAESILPIYNNASQILVKIDASNGPNTAEVEQYYRDKIQSLFPNLKVRRWAEFLGAIANISKSFDVISSVVSAIGLAVAAITIFILIYVNAVNKRRQIGILKAIGIKQNIIIGSYIIQALFYTLSGIIIGLILIFYLIEPYFFTHPLKLPIGDTYLALHAAGVILSILSLLMAGLIAGFIPAWQVAREDILKAIWG